MSIALGQLSKIATGHVIRQMQTISETRLARLAILVKQHGGSLATLNEAIGLDRTDATLSQIRTKAPHSKTKKPRVMGDDLARKIEEALRLPIGWMDTPPAEAEQPAHRVEEPAAQYAVNRQYDVYTMAAIGVMLSLPESQRDGALAALRTHVQNLSPPRDGQTLPMAA